MMMVTPTREAELNLSQTTNCFWSCLLAGGELMGYFSNFWDQKQDLSLFQASSDSAGKGNTHLVLEGLHSKLHFRLQMSKMAFITASTNSLTSRKDVTYKVLTQIKTRILLNITLCDICLKVINNNKTIPGKWIPLNSQHNNIFCLLIARNRSNFTCFGCAHMFIFSSLKTRWNGWLTFLSCFFHHHKETPVCVFYAFSSFQLRLLMWGPKWKNMTLSYNHFPVADPIKCDYHNFKGICRLSSFNSSS